MDNVRSKSEERSRDIPSQSCVRHFWVSPELTSSGHWGWKRYFLGMESERVRPFLCICSARPKAAGWT